MWLAIREFILDGLWGFNSLPKLSSWKIILLAMGQNLMKKRIWLVTLVLLRLTNKRMPEIAAPIQACNYLTRYLSLSLVNIERDEY
jgi:hypothetical protein